MKFFVKSFGCKVNQYEIQKICELLEMHGGQKVQLLSAAEFLIINSCAVTENAVVKIRRYINSIKNKYPNLKIILVGCIVNYLNNINGFLDNVDYCFDNKNKFGVIDFCLNGRRLPAARADENLHRIENYKIRAFNERSRAFIKIQDGCDNFCSYCIIPHLRSNLISRDYSNIIEELTNLTNAGYKEIILTGINIGKYNFANTDLAGLLKKLLRRLDNNCRLRLSSINVNSITDEFIELLSDNRLCPHLHISLQSGSNRILRLMNRNYTRDYYLQIVEKLKTAISDLSITTDVIVGFPSETVEDFTDTINVIQQIQSLRTHIFPYSDRIGTAAAGFNDKVADSIKTDRLKTLRQIAFEQTANFILKRRGRVYTIIGEFTQNSVLGYTENYIRGCAQLPVNKKTNSTPNTEFIAGSIINDKIIKVKIIGFDEHSETAIFDII